MKRRMTGGQTGSSEDHKMSYLSGDRSYEPGEVIVHCDAFFKGLCLAHKDTRCNTCFKKKDVLMKCPTCKNVSYCDVDCRKKDEVNGHSLECTSPGFQASLNLWAKENMIMLFRLYALLKLNSSLSKELYTMHDRTTRCFNDLMSHHSQLILATRTVSICEDLVKCLQGEDKEVRVDHFIRLQGILWTNAFAICEEGVLIGYGLYMQGSNFDHSCKPTANCSIVDAKLEVRAMVSIPRGVAPLIFYLMEMDLVKLDDRSTRRAILKKQFIFDCSCERCLSENTGNFSYAKFKEMHAKMETLMDTTSATTMGWKEVLDLHNQYIANLRELLNEYDEVITTYLVNFCRLAEKLNADKEVIAHFRKETLGHIRITFGENCTLYHEFHNPSNKN